MISPDEEVELYHLLTDRLCDLDVSLELSDLVAVWDEYLRPLGIRRVKADHRPEEDLYMSADPLEPTKSRLLIPWGAVEKMLFVGLP